MHFCASKLGLTTAKFIVIGEWTNMARELDGKEKNWILWSKHPLVSVGLFFFIPAT